MTMSRFVLTAAAAVAATASIPSMSHAGSYASGITESGGNVSFVLNDAATDVTIVRDGVATSLGALPEGTHSFARNGASSYYIQVSNTAAPGWTLISTDTTQNNFELPRGVGVNTTSSTGGAPNPYFGRVYVANGRESNTAAGRTQQSGLYLLNADLTDAVGQGDSARTGGIAFLTATSTPADTGGSDPFRIQVGPDNRVYVTSFLDTRAGLWSTDADVTSNVDVFDNTGRSATGLNTTSGNVLDMVIVGTGANRRIYTADEDLNTSQRGIYQYNVGNTTTFSGAPVTLFSDPSNAMQNNFQSLAASPDGTFWLSQNRAGSATDLLPSLIQVDASGNELWNSLSLSGSGASDQDPLRTTQGIAFDPVNDVIALASARSGSPNTGLIFIFDDDTKTILAQFNFNTLTSGSTNTDLAFDAAGNLYVGNRSTERLRVWSPGGNSIWTSGSDGSFVADLAPIPEPGSLALLSLGGLFLARRRRA
jgi:hypothetical protein